MSKISFTFITACVEVAFSVKGVTAANAGKYASGCCRQLTSGFGLQLFYPKRVCGRAPQLSLLLVSCLDLPSVCAFSSCGLYKRTKIYKKVCIVNVAWFD